MPSGYPARLQRACDVSHLLGKLGAASRTEAVARARGLGLIP
jgi:DNA-binding NarL/FixJ family response regulator